MILTLLIRKNNIYYEIKQKTRIIEWCEKVPQDGALTHCACLGCCLAMLLVWTHVSCHCLVSVSVWRAFHSTWFTRYKCQNWWWSIWYACYGEYEITFNCDNVRLSFVLNIEFKIETSLKDHEWPHSSR